MAKYFAFLLEGLDEIESIRGKYDCLCKLVPAHLTIVFPCDIVDCKEEPISEYLSSIPEINVELVGVTGSADNLMFCTLTKGNDELIALHRHLYFTYFRRFYNRKHTFYPHVTVGRFSTDHELDSALEGTVSINPVQTSLSSLALIEILTSGERRVLRKFKLGDKSSL